MIKISLQELLKTPSFNQMMDVLTVKESIIISLKLGYIDGKYFSTESISQLSMNQRIKLCLLMKRNFRAGVKQIARLTRLDPTVVAKVI